MTTRNKKQYICKGYFSIFTAQDVLAMPFYALLDKNIHVKIYRPIVNPAQVLNAL